MNKTIEKALNEQINKELYSAYLYYSMASWFESNNLKGASHWVKTQALEEMVHVAKFFDYINDRDGQVKLTSVDEPRNEWSSIEAVFADVLEHEKSISESINQLVGLAQKENDIATQTFLQWFVTEQVEEEASVKEIIDQMKLISGAPAGLYQLDKELKARPLPATLTASLQTL